MENGKVAYAKVYDDPTSSLTHWAKRLLRLHQAFREWATLIALSNRGVPAVQPIAIVKSVIRSGDHRSGRGTLKRMVLVTDGFEPSESLVAAWEASQRKSGVDRTQESRGILRAASELWASSHDRGYAHPDGHPGNVLVRHVAGPDGDCWQALFVDPASTSIAFMRNGRVSLTGALRSLAMLNQYLARTVSKSDRLRFWRDYWVRRGELMGRDVERRILSRFEQIVAIHRNALARQRDRRLKGDGRYFLRVRLSGGWKGVVALRLARRHVFPEPDVIDRTKAHWEAFLPSATREIMVDAGVPDGLKIQRMPSGARSGWAKRVFEHTHRLRHRDIPAPLVLGFLECKSGPRAFQEFLILSSSNKGPVP